MTDNEKRLLRATQVEERYGFARSTLLRWEDEGKLAGIVSRTPGGQRRYDASGIESIMAEVDTENDDFEDRIPSFDEFGTTGISRWSESDYSEQLRALRGHAGRRLYREMRMNDPVISAMFFGITHAIRRASYNIVPASDSATDRAAAEFVDQCFQDMSWSFSDQFTFCIDPMMEQGFSLLEVVFKKRQGEFRPNNVDPETPFAPSKHDDGLIGWRKWAPRPALSLKDQDEWVFDKNGGIRGVNQAIGLWPYTGKVRQIPIQKLLHFRTTVHPANNPEGVPIHRASFIPYNMTRNFQELEGIGFERDVSGIPTVYLGRGTTKRGPDSDFSKSKQLVANVKKDHYMGLVFPHPKMTSNGEGVLFELTSAQSRRTYDTTGIINRYDKRKALSVLAQFIMLGMENVGSYALSKHQGDLFIMAISTWLDSVADNINRHAIPKLMRFNAGSFPNITDTPRFSPGSVGEVDLAGFADFVNKLVEKNVLTPDQELENKVRELAHLPKATIEVTAEERRNSNNPMQQQNGFNNFGPNGGSSTN